VVSERPLFGDLLDRSVGAAYFNLFNVGEESFDEVYDELLEHVLLVRT